MRYTTFLSYFWNVTERNRGCAHRNRSVQGTILLLSEGTGKAFPPTVFIIAYSYFDVKPESDEEISQSCDCVCFATVLSVLCKKKEITRLSE